MIKIVHVISGLNTGGAEMMLFKLLSVWDRADCQIEVISLTDVGAIGERIRRLDIPITALGMPRGRPSVTGFFRLARRLRNCAPDVIQTWMYHADLIGGLAARFAGGFPVIWGIRNGLLEPRGNKRTTIWTAKVSARLSRSVPIKIVCCSESTRGFHEAMGYCSQKMLVIPNGFDMAASKLDADARTLIRQELKLPSDAVLIGLIARWDPQKDHENFIRAARLVALENPDVHFLLCGHGITWDNTEIAAWINEAGLKDRSHLLGRREDIPRLMAALDILASSSYGEAFPNVLGEAMASGVPCVATDVGDSAFIIGDTGKIVPAKDPAQLAKALNWMISAGPDERKNLGVKARRRIQENFDLSSIRARYESLYLDVAKKS